jgi:NAD(P)-dependent dehydrogenase (short-subunit alcohol dehydrogenase family)
MQTIAITGVTSGFGTEWLYALDSKLNGNFFILARNVDKLQKLINSRPLKNRFQVIECDFMDLRSVKNAAAYISSQTDFLSMLINNAGVWSNTDISLSKDSVEQTFAVNQLASYVLTGYLLPLLVKSGVGRIVNTASFRHKDARVNKQDIELRDSFNAEQAYCNSKLFNVLFTRYLAENYSSKGVASYCFDPGIVDTPMLKQGFPRHLKFIYPAFRKLIARSPKKGAETGIYLCTESSENLVSGEYYKDMRIKPVSSQANDRALGKWLWAQCEQISGFTYPQINK